MSTFGRIASTKKVQTLNPDKESLYQPLLSMRSRTQALWQKLSSLAVNWHPKVVGEALGKRADDLWVKLTKIQTEMEKKPVPPGIWPPPVDSLLGPKNDLHTLAQKVMREIEAIERRAEALIKRAEQDMK